ncbi:hypothetical protein FOA52_000547 [Chlamydomonas sp. UWO 241]|nr:hypothetical protein FOA52_000547 [Chlamydomonas sp. UWO 241]
MAMMGGNAAALSIISWEGYLSGLLGNMLMLTHFAGRGERSAVNVQHVGIINNMLVLGLVAAARFMPLPAFVATSALVATAVLMCTGRIAGLGSGLPLPESGGGLSAWSSWQLAIGVAGLALIPQVAANMLLHGQLGAGPMATGLTLGAVWAAVQMRSEETQRQLAGVAEQLPGWAATLLFALSPLPQLVRNFAEPGSLEGLSLGTMLLALTGNALMLPRALFTRDRVWIVGASWGCIAGWGQLLSMRIGGYLATAPFAVITLVLLAYVGIALRENARHKTKTVESVWDTDY